jgi:Uma2 family endonuclease
MTRVAARSKLTAAEYLAWEREQTDKHEFHAGEVFAMAGGSPRHNVIAGNIQTALKLALKGRCVALPSDQRVMFDDGARYVYPDVSVVCGKAVLQDGTKDVLVNPTILVEVLSSGTEQHDRGLKWKGYQRLASLTDYLLVAQHEVRVEQFQRAPDGQWLYRTYGRGDRVPLADGTQIDVGAMYEDAFDYPGD